MSQSTAPKDNLEKSGYSQSELLQLFHTMLASSRLPDDFQVDPVMMEDPDFVKVYNFIMDLRELSHALSQGDLQKFVFSKGFVLSNLKALQSNLRHLTWQTQKVAEGDFSQRVDFLGDFSDSFNEMIVKLRDSTHQMQRLASLDVLTQIPNRLALEEFLTQAFQEARQGDKPFSVLIIDIDHFKLVNDTYGHNIGDRVLVKITKVLNQQFRGSDIFARYGGEEFVAGLPGTSLEMAERIAQRARQAVDAEPLEVLDGFSLSLTVSIGVSDIRPEDTTYADIITRSDEALYEAKRNGRNQVRLA